MCGDGPRRWGATHVSTTPTPEDRPPATFGDAIAAHRQRVEEVLPGGDPDEIKRLYIELGSLIDTAVAGDPSDLPALSFPENGPVIGALLDDMMGRVVDAGCGPNPIFSIRLAARPENRVVSLDISHDIVRLGVARARDAGVRILGIVGDLERLPFRDAVFDGCICEDTIEHIPSDEKAVAEIARVLVPDGRLVIGTPNRVRFDVLRARLRDRLRGIVLPASAYYAASSHLREYTWSTLERVVAPWFSIRRRVSVGWDGGVRARALTALVDHWPFRWISRMIVFDARKTTL